MKKLHNEAWQEIWEAKASRGETELHRIDGNDLLTIEEWECTVRAVTAPLSLRAGMSVLELGCGAGAFLAVLKKLEPTIQITGLDYSPAMIATASARLAGSFFVGDICNCPMLPSVSSDLTCSFGVMMYLNADADAIRALAEIDRVTRPGGQIYIGEVSDLAKRDLALETRRLTHANHQRVATADIPHLYLPRALFLDEGQRLGWRKTRVIDHADIPALQGNPLAGYRYSFYAQKGDVR